MIIVHEELWNRMQLPTMVVVTTNSVVCSYGLVMGRGSAGEAAARYPGLAREAEKAIRCKLPGFVLDGTGDYGFVVVRKSVAQVGIGLLQAKRHWKDKSALPTIEKSVLELGKYALLHPVLPSEPCSQASDVAALGMVKCLTRRSFSGCCVPFLIM